MRRLFNCMQTAPGAWYRGSALVPWGCPVAQMLGSPDVGQPHCQAMAHEGGMVALALALALTPALALAIALTLLLIGRPQQVPMRPHRHLR